MLSHPVAMNVHSIPSPLHELCVVVADDDPTILGLLALLLEEEGYRVGTATNGQEALALIEGDSPSVLLLDVHMPVLDGPGVIRRLRDQGRTLPVILLSAEREGVGPRLAKELGAVTFIPKPFELDQILATVQQHCHPTQGLSAA